MSLKSQDGIVCINNNFVQPNWSYVGPKYKANAGSKRTQRGGIILLPENLFTEYMGDSC